MLLTDDSNSLERVRRSGLRTIEASTARMIVEHRLGTAAGPLAQAPAVGEGQIDFRRRRAQFTQAHQGTLGWSETILDGPVVYGRFDPQQRYFLNPGCDDPKGPLRYGITPLFLVEALAGVASIEILGMEDVRGVRTTHMYGQIDSERASAHSSLGLSYPTQDRREFPAEVWLDSDGRVRRVGAFWARTPMPDQNREPEATRDSAPDHWPIAEFWDYGIPDPIALPEWVISPANPTEPVRPAGWKA